MIDLIKSFLEAQREEYRAKAKRLRLADEIAAKLAHPDEGSKTHTIEQYKIIITQHINRKVDWDALDAVIRAYDLYPPVRTKRELDITGLKWCEKNEPDYYNELTKTITVTPGLPSVIVKEKSK